MRRLAIAALLLGLAGPALATVTVFAPAAGTAEVSGTRDAPSPASLHTWSVASDEVRGATVTFAAEPFSHTTVAGARPNVRLSLTLLSGSGWAVDLMQDTSEPGSPAAVGASSNAAGDAQLQLGVSFVPGDASILPAGAYTTTIVATVSANP